MAVDPAKTYHGKPCKKCGGTQRWKGDRSCVPCKRVLSNKFAQRKYARDSEWAAAARARNRANYHTKRADPEWLEAERARNRARQRAKYAADPETGRETSYSAYLRRVAQERPQIERQLLEIQAERRRLEEVIANGG